MAPGQGLRLLGHLPVKPSRAEVKDKLLDHGMECLADRKLGRARTALMAAFEFDGLHEGEALFLTSRTTKLWAKWAHEMDRGRRW